MSFIENSTYLIIDHGYGTKFIDVYRNRNSVFSELKLVACYGFKFLKPVHRDNLYYEHFILDPKSTYEVENTVGTDFLNESHGLSVFKSYLDFDTLNISSAFTTIKELNSLGLCYNLNPENITSISLKKHNEISVIVITVDTDDKF